MDQGLQLPEASTNINLSPNFPSEGDGVAGGEAVRDAVGVRDVFGEMKDRIGAAQRQGETLLHFPMSNVNKTNISLLDGAPSVENQFQILKQLETVQKTLQSLAISKGNLIEVNGDSKGHTSISKSENNIVITHNTSDVYPNVIVTTVASSYNNLVKTSTLSQRPNMSSFAQSVGFPEHDLQSTPLKQPSVSQPMNQSVSFLPGNQYFTSKKVVPEPAPFMLLGMRSFRDFLAEFNTYVTEFYTNLTQAQKCSRLKPYLSGELLKLYLALAQTELPYDQMVNQLDVFVSSERRKQIILAASEFQEMKYKKGDPVAAYAALLKAKFCQAYPGMHEDSHALLFKFKTSFPTSVARELEKYHISKPNATWSDFVNMATQFSDLLNRWEADESTEVVMMQKLGDGVTGVPNAVLDCNRRETNYGDNQDNAFNYRKYNNVAVVPYKDEGQVQGKSFGSPNLTKAYNNNNYQKQNYVYNESKNNNRHFSNKQTGYVPHNRYQQRKFCDFHQSETHNLDECRQYNQFCTYCNVRGHKVDRCHRVNRSQTNRTTQNFVKTPYQNVSSSPNVELRGTTYYDSSTQPQFKSNFVGNNNNHVPRYQARMPGQYNEHYNGYKSQQHAGIRNSQPLN